MALIVVIAVTWLALGALTALLFAAVGRAGAAEDRALAGLVEASERRDAA
jgi:hypothetical protein